MPVAIWCGLFLDGVETFSITKSSSFNWIININFRLVIKHNKKNQWKRSLAVGVIYGLNFEGWHQWKLTILAKTLIQLNTSRHGSQKPMKTAWFLRNLEVSSLLELTNRSVYISHYTLKKSKWTSSFFIKIIKYHKFWTVFIQTGETRSGFQSDNSFDEPCWTLPTLDTVHPSIRLNHQDDAQFATWRF